MKEIMVEEIDSCITFFTTCRFAFPEADEVVFLFACNVNNDTTESHQYALQYPGQTTPEEWSCVIKADLNLKDMEVKVKKHSVHSLLLKDEIVWSVFEYAPNCMLLSLNNTPNLLMVENLKTIRVITDSDKTNNYKYWIAPLPGFNMDTFPFLVSAGAKAFSLINVKQQKLEKLINATSFPDAAMEGAFFTVDKGTITMNFASFMARFDNPEQMCFQWNKFSFHKDFQEAITALGRLPDLSLKTHFKLKSEQKKHQQ